MNLMDTVQHCLFFLYGYSLKDIKKIIKVVTISKISIKYAMSKFYILDLALKGVKNPINEFEKKFNNKAYFKDVIKEIQKVKKLKNKPHSSSVKKLGMACSYPGTFNSAVHSILTSSNYKTAVLKTIKAGGCNCSKSKFCWRILCDLKWERLNTKILDQKNNFCTENN